MLYLLEKYAHDYVQFVDMEALGKVVFRMGDKGGASVEGVFLNRTYFERDGEEQVGVLFEELVRNKEYKKVEVLMHELHHREVVEGKKEIDMKKAEGSAFLFGKVAKYYTMVNNEPLAFLMAYTELISLKGKSPGSYFRELYVDPAMDIAEEVFGREYIFQELIGYNIEKGH